MWLGCDGRRHRGALLTVLLRPSSLAIICCVCADTLDQKQVTQYYDDVAKFSSVKPTCGSPDCGPFRTSRPRKVPLKRKRTAKPAKSVKKQRISPWVRLPKKETDEWSLWRLSYSLVSPIICRDTKNREDTKKHTKTWISGKVYRISKVYRFARARARPRAPPVTRT